MRPDDKEQHVVLVNAKGEDIIDANGRIVTMPKLAAHIEGRRHRSVSVFIFSSRGEVMLQKRAANKYHSPGMWSNTCCTHPKPYEIPADTVRRRLEEEMGLHCPLEEIFTFTYSADVGNQLIENEFDHVFFGFTDNHPVINPNEVADWRWHRLDDLGRDMTFSSKQYTPWLRYCYTNVISEYNKHRIQTNWKTGNLNAQDPVFDYLCVDEFMSDVVGARALATAFELGLIDNLIENKTSTFDDLEKRYRIDRRGLKLLADMLIRNGVIENRKEEIALRLQFERALKYRDLLEAKLAFANYVAPDFTALFSILISSPDRFFQRARIFDLFSYNRCIEYSPENYKLTKRWVRITTVLTKYEAAACMKYHDFSPYKRILDIGGNSGEFALRICRNQPHIHANVFDLPVVCDIGMEHIGPEPEADRITFIKGNALTDVLPYGFDLITFKSMLHDWPENQALEFIARAEKALNPGGTLLIFERSSIEFNGATIPYSMIPFLMFFRSFRSPAIYENKLEDLGFQDIRTRRIELDMPFFLITGRKT